MFFNFNHGKILGKIAAISMLYVGFHWCHGRWLQLCKMWINMLSKASKKMAIYGKPLGRRKPQIFGDRNIFEL
jgi:hypothetical protein